MEDQGKRLLLAVGIIAVLFIVWNVMFPPRRPQPAAPAATPAAQSAPASAAGPTPTTAPATAAAPATPSGPATAPPVAPVAEAPEACEPEKDGAPRWDTADYVATFSRCGGTLASFKLKGSQYREHHDDQGRQIDLVLTGTDPRYFPLQAQVLTPPGASTNPDEKRSPIIPAGATWKLESASADQVVYSWRSPDGALVVQKTFRKLAGKYIFALDLEVKNVSPKAGDKRLTESGITLYGYQNPNVAQRSMFHYADPTWGTACYIDGSLKKETAKSLHSEPHTGIGDVRWVGLDHQYFLFAVAPLQAQQATCARSMVTSREGVLRADLDFALPTTLEPKQSLKQSLVVYAGPKLLDQLEKVSKTVGHDTRLREAVDLGYLAFLARPMLFLLKLFHGWVGNWGLSIILLTIVVKLLTLYWTQKSMRSMKAMSKLKPEMDKVKERFPDDKQRQNLEMMNLYKAHKISPFGGCLPLLLQMPIWFALYRTLASSADLYHAPFLWWIHDLTAPDPLYIIPILLMVLMFLQAKISPTSIDSSQQKIMQWMMPIMMGVFSLLFPAGLAVYMTTNTVLGMGHQYYLNKTDPTGKPAVATADRPSEPPKSSGNAPRRDARPRGGKRKNAAKARG